MSTLQTLTETRMPLADVRGRHFTPMTDPHRVVSLVPSTTETLFALGLGEAVAGYTRFAVHPQDHLTPEKWIGGTKNPKIDRIVALAPQIVFANREENRAEDVSALEDAGIPVWVAEPRTVQDAIDDIRAMGRLLNRSARANALADEGAGALRDVREAARRRPPWRFVYYIWREPWMAAGDETFIHALLAEAGGINVCTGRYPTLPPSEVPSVSPDVILLSSEPFPFGQAHIDEVQRAVDANIPIRLVDGELLSWHGVRLRQGLPYAAKLAIRVACEASQT